MPVNAGPVTGRVVPPGCPAGYVTGEVPGGLAAAFGGAGWVAACTSGLARNTLTVTVIVNPPATVAGRNRLRTARPTADVTFDHALASGPAVGAAGEPVTAPGE